MATFDPRVHTAGTFSGTTGFTALKGFSVKSRTDDVDTVQALAKVVAAFAEAYVLIVEWAEYAAYESIKHAKDLSASLNEFRGNIWFDVNDWISSVSETQEWVGTIRKAASEVTHKTQRVAHGFLQFVGFGVYFSLSLGLKAASKLGHEYPEVAKMVGLAGPFMLMAGFAGNIWGAVLDRQETLANKAAAVAKKNDLHDAELCYNGMLALKATAALPANKVDLSLEGLGKKTLGEMIEAYAGHATSTSLAPEVRKAALDMQHILEDVGAKLAGNATDASAAKSANLIMVKAAVQELLSLTQAEQEAHALSIENLHRKAEKAKWTAVKHTANLFGMAVVTAVTYGILNGTLPIVRAMSIGAKITSGWTQVYKFDTVRDAISNTFEKLISNVSRNRSSSIRKPENELQAPGSSIWAYVKDMVPL